MTTCVSQKGCKEKALFLVFGPKTATEPEGPSTGSWYCEKHGRAVIEELWTKSQERWWLAPIDDYGRVVDGDLRIYAKGAPTP